MTNGLFRNLILARASGVEPIAHALCPDHLDTDRGPFSRPSNRWQRAAQRAALRSGATDLGLRWPEPDEPSHP